MALGIFCVILGIFWLFFNNSYCDNDRKILAGSVIVILAGGIMCFCGEDFLWLFLALLLFLGGHALILIPIFLIGQNRVRKAEQELRGYVTFDPKKQEVQIIKRGNVLRSAISIREVVDRVTRYEPEKLHFGAVTVGGVTTGGTYKTGGFYQGEKIHTGKYTLICNDSHVITIKLPPELVKEAKKSSIKKYLDKDGTIVVIDFSKATTGPSADIALRLANTDMNAYLAYTQPYKWSHYPSQEKCKEILDWLCQE